MLGVVLVGGSRATKGLADVIDSSECVVRMKTGLKLPAVEVGTKTDYLTFIHYRHWQQKKATPKRGLMWEKKPDGPNDGDEISVLPDSVRLLWRQKMTEYGIREPSLGLCSLIMVIYFLSPPVVICAACDSFFDEIELPGCDSKNERKLISGLNVERLC